MELNDLKSEFKPLGKKYKLPSFDELNEAFEIDRIERETDFLLREVRKSMMDKILRYIQFTEMMLNPAQAPPMFLMFLKEVTEGERKIIQGCYKNFVELELHSLRLEIDYEESKEAGLIREIFDTWQNTRPEMGKVIDVLEKNWNGSPSVKIKGYFG